MKRVTGDMNRRSQRVGISFTSMKKAVKITRIKSRFRENSTPQKDRREKLARPAPKR